jgi:hypothetical protein
MSDIVLSGESKGGGYTIPEGVHIGICYGCFDVGTQTTEWKGETKQKREVVIVWEIPDERIKLEKDGKEVDLPRAVSKIYTASLGEKANLRKDLTAWRGKDFTDAELKAFSLTNILGKACQLQIVHRKVGDKTYANIQSLMALPKGVKVNEPENPKIMWKIGDKTDGVPAWIIGKAQKALEWVEETPAVTQEAHEEEEEGSDIPF